MLSLPLRPLLAALAVAVLGSLAPPPAAAAWTGPCLPDGGPACTFWSARVSAVHDGDTLDVRLEGRRVRVRVTGIQTMEQTVYSTNPRRRRGECHALAATARFEQLVRRGGGRVRLAAQRRSSHAGRRLRRSVAVRIGGRWQDVGRVLVAEGHALWLPNPHEYAWNRTLNELAQRAAWAGRRLWNDRSCGAGPATAGGVGLWVNWNAAGNDHGNPNGEYAVIRNFSETRRLSLRGWWFRDSALRRYRFPRWASVPPGGWVRVRVGRGTASGREFFWGLRGPAFENAARDERAMGDGAYLFDPQGDLRAWDVYPCRAAC